jgi:hypothetical protein
MLVADCHAKVLAQQHVVNRHRVFPTGFKPVPVKKVSRGIGQKKNRLSGAKSWI